MKQALFCLLLTLVGISLNAQDRGLYWKYKDYDGSLSFTLPRWVIHAGSWFVDEKADRKLIRKVHKVRALVFEDQDSPVIKSDVDKFARKAARRRLDHMLSVREQQTRVEIWAKERRDKVRKIVILVREPETFVLVSLRTRMSIDEIGKLLEAMPKDSNKKSEQKLIPENVRSVIKI